LQVCADTQLKVVVVVVGKLKEADEKYKKIIFTHDMNHGGKKLW